MKCVDSVLTYLKDHPLYLDEFSSRADVFKQFNVDDDPDVEFAYADYSYEDYSGNATVFYYRKSTGKFYQLYGSHCSCYGLEDQWGKDEELCTRELQQRLKDGYLSDNGKFKRYVESFDRGI
jgi:hypothetical protein